MNNLFDIVSSYAAVVNDNHMYENAAPFYDYCFFDGPVKCYDKFGIGPDQVEYSNEEHKFRLACLREEHTELKAAVVAGDKFETIDAIVDLLFFAIGTSYRSGTLNKTRQYYHLYNSQSIFHIMRAARLVEYKSNINKFIVVADEYINELSACSIYAPITYQEHVDKIISLCIVYLLSEYNVDMITQYYDRVTAANLSKELGSLPKRGSFALDLRKPEGWKAPSFDGLDV